MRTKDDIEIIQQVKNLFEQVEKYVIEMANSGHSIRAIKYYVSRVHGYMPNKMIRALIKKGKTNEVHS